MSSLIKKIQQIALDPTISCFQVINTTYYFAKKINDVDLINFCKSEIYGYPDVRVVPIYRFISVEYRMKDLYGRMIPLQIPFSDKQFSFLEKLPIKESIGELENLFEQSKDNYLYLSIPSELQSALNQLSDNPLKKIMEFNIYAIFPKSQITKIFNTIKMEVLNKIMEFENKGIDVDDTTLQKEESKTSETVNIVIEGSADGAVLGNIMSNSNIYNNKNNSTKIYNYSEVEKILKEIKKQYKKVRIEKEKQKQIANDIKEIKKAIKDKNDSIITNKFQDIKSLLIGIKGSLIASGIIEVIKTLLGA